MLVGLDSPSIGAFGPPDYEWGGPQSYRTETFKAIESHLGVFKHGGVDVEGLLNLDQVPSGSVFIALPVKNPEHAHRPDPRRSDHRPRTGGRAVAGYQGAARG